MSATPGRVHWKPVLERAAEIVNEYETQVTLRQLFYRLVSELLIPNTTSAYKQLSSRTAQARRDGTFPRLYDRGRVIHRSGCWSSPSSAVDAVVSQYRLDRTAGQDVSIFLAVEKNGLVELIRSWFDPFGLPVLALGGYSSQDYVDRVVAEVCSDLRPAVLIYAGDFDPSGEDILRDFEARTACWDEVVRVALNPEQVIEYELPPMMGKATDSRAAQFVARHGELVQVELDALPPDALRGLYEAAMRNHWDDGAYERTLIKERQDVSILREFAAVLGADR